MGYCCVGNMSNADWEKIKKLCTQMHKDMDKALHDLETKLEGEIQDISSGQIQTLINNVQALTVQVNSFVTGQAVQDARLDKLENDCANLELTRDEVLKAYNGD